MCGFALKSNHSLKPLGKKNLENWVEFFTALAFAGRKKTLHFILLWGERKSLLEFPTFWCYLVSPMAPHSSTLAWKIPWMEEPSGLQSMGSLRVGHDWAASLSLFTFHFHALEEEMATHSSVFAWRIPGTVGPGGLPSMGSHRVGHDWSDLAAAAAMTCELKRYATGFKSQYKSPSFLLFEQLADGDYSTA